jgi:hypothetical protein
LRYRLNAEQLKQLKKATDSAKNVEEKILHPEGDAAKAVRQHIEIRKLDGGAVGDLRKEVEALRKAVEELKAAKGKQDGQSESQKDKEDSDSSDQGA